MTRNAFTGKKCLITGAASGIGRATARAAAAKGAIVFLTDVDAERLLKVAVEIGEAGGTVAVHAALDVSDYEAVRSFAAKVHAAHGPMDIVMNIAGISVWGAVQDLEHKHWKRTVDVNLMGPIHFIEAFIPEMIRGGGGGHLVNVASAAGLLGLPRHAAYSASKFGLRGISEVLRFDLEPHGIDVSLVCPGGVDTGLVSTVELVGFDGDPGKLERMKADFRKHAISPEQAAQAILRGIEGRTYLVFTSFDIRALFWLQSFIPFAYRLVMRRLGAKLQSVVGPSRRDAARAAGARNGVATGLLLMLVLILSAVVGCGSDSDPEKSPEGTGGPPGGQGVSLAAFTCPGGTIAEGMNTIPVGNLSRSFYAEFPPSTDEPLGIVFSWHGYNDPGSDGDSAGWRKADQVDATLDPSHPVVVVTPSDTDFDAPVGLDWQLDKGTAADNVDLAFFEAMVGCFDAQYDIDATRIHSYGFSAGSVMTSLIHSAYPDIVNAVVCESGMWFNDPVQVSLVQLIPLEPSWPDLDAADGGTVLLTHGGPTDITVLNVANLEDMAQAAFPFLAANDRVVIDCPHTRGHALHPQLTTAEVMTFFADHPAGQPSPYVGSTLSGFPSGCVLREP